MASSTGVFAIGALIGIMVGYLAHAPLQQIFTQGSSLGLGKVGYAYTGSKCGCGR